MRNKLFFVVVTALILAAAASPASAQATNPVTETMYILPKRGMNEQLENAIKAHNAKYHPEGPYVAGLRSVDYGAKSGWYVWLMGPTTYASIDSRPDKGAHDEDWNKTVDPLIEEYGEPKLWELDPNLSFGREILTKSGHYDVWAIDVKRGEMERFNELTGKVKKAYESIGDRAFMVYRSMVHTPGDADVAYLTSYTSLADWAADWKVKEAYEKLNGAGSWAKMMTTWNEVVVDFNEELRSYVK
ncbi:MAG: hypothetical protein KBF32_08150 [Chitinophagales bacterium]|nr:hypothetical protein [Chitinophagales bacterium]